MPALTVRPAEGGKLITRASASDASVPHYTAKLNWRRDLSDEIIREGYDYFAPLGEIEGYLDHPFPGTTDPLTLVHLVRRPNGDASVVVGTKTTLYRFRFDVSGYVENPPLYAEGVGDLPYFEEPSRWQIIGTGFSSNARRWEAEDIDGTATFNNSSDLPVQFRVEWDSVKPDYELREQGIVCVGTIGSSDGILLCADITELHPGDMDAVLGVLKSSVDVYQPGYKSGVATSTGTVVTAIAAMFSADDVGRVLAWSTGERSRITGFIDATKVSIASGTVFTAGKNIKVTDEISDGWPGGVSTRWDAYALRTATDFFTDDMVGETITWPNGEYRRIVAVYSPTLARTDTDVPVAAAKVYRENPLAYAGKDAIIAAGIPTFNRRQYRLLWSNVAQPGRFAAILTAQFAAASKLITVPRASRSLEMAQSVALSKAGANSGVLTGAVIQSSAPGLITISKAAQSTGTGTIQQSDSIGTIVGLVDLQDDGSGILKMQRLAGRVVIYKDTHIFVAKYVANVDSPWSIERIAVPHGRSLYFRNTLVSIQDVAHVYAGKDRFYRFDLTSRQPQPIPDADLAANVFFDNASIEETESIFAADNHPTQEIWIVVPNKPTLCFDYLYSTFSTTDTSPSSASTVKAASYPLVAEGGEWFLMGWNNGTLLMNGLTTELLSVWNVADPQKWQDGKRIYYRRSANPYSATKGGYSAKLASGMINFGAATPDRREGSQAHDETHLERYIIGLSSQPQITGDNQPTLSVSFYYTVNQNLPESLLGTATIVDAANHGLIPIHATSHYFRDEVQVSVNENPIRLHDRTWDFQIIGSKSHHRK